MATVAAGILLQLFSLMWSSPDVIGQFSPNVVSFSPNVVLRDPLFSLNVVSKPRMLSVRGNYVLSSLQVRASSSMPAPHEHWHVDISYLNIMGTFFYLCSVLDGCSRFLLHWELRTAVKEFDVEIVLQRAGEKYPATSPRRTG